MNRSHVFGAAAATLLIGGGLLAAVEAKDKPSPFAARPAAAKAEGKPAVGAPLTLPAGTIVHVRLNSALGTSTNHPGDRFEASLDEPLMVDGKTVAQKGAAVSGLVREAQPSGRLKGRAVMILALESVDANGHRLSLTTNSQTWQSGAHKKRNLGCLGGGAGSGALIGGLAGGPVGLGIGAGAGAAAGFTGAALTGRRQVRLPAETLVNFRLGHAVTIQPAS